MELDGYLGGDLSAVPARVRELEGQGFDGAYTAEGPHEPFLPLLLAAEHSRRLRLYTNIAVAFARSPMDLAQLSNDLQLASRGRFVLGLGSQVRPHITKRFGMTWSRPVARMAEVVRAVKAVHRAWNERGPLRFEGQFYRHTLMTPFFDPGPNPFGAPPIFVAGLGPRMVSTAAEVADGLLVHPFHSGRYLHEHAAPAVERGLTASGRKRSDFTVAAVVIVATGSTDEERSRADAGVRRLLAFYGSTPAYRVTLDAHGLGDLQAELNLLSKQGRWAEMQALVTEEVVDIIAVRGEPAEIGPRCAARYGRAIDRLGFSMPYDVAPSTVPAVLESFRTTSSP